MDVKLDFVPQPQGRTDWEHFDTWGMRRIYGHNRRLEKTAQ
jgi:hypothetical protein